MRNLRQMLEKRGISPIIATAILVGVVVTLGVIVWLFTKGFVSELIMKDNAPVSTVCSDKVRISAEIMDGKLVVSNDGSVPIAGVMVETRQGGTADREWENCPLDVGQSSAAWCDIIISSTYYDEIKIIPSILGEGEKSGDEKLFMCEQKAEEIR